MCSLIEKLAVPRGRIWFKIKLSEFIQVIVEGSQDIVVFYLSLVFYFDFGFDFDFINKLDIFAVSR